MKKLILIVLCCTLLLASCAPAPVSAEDVAGIADSFIADLKSQNTSALLNNYQYDSQMQKLISEDMFHQIYTDLTTNYGEWQNTEPFETSVTKNYRNITYPAIFANGYLNINIIFDHTKKIAGIRTSVRSESLPAATASSSTVNGISNTEVTFGKDPYVLSGTLSLPAGTGPFPAVILVHGSGPSNRDESVGGNKPFADIADYLSSKGIAVLRYDKRTYTYGTQINAEKITPKEETIDDAVYAYDFLKSNASINSAKIFILGHSLGGYLIPQIAQAAPDAAGYIMVSAPSSPIQELMLQQYSYIFNLDGTLTPEESAQLAAVRQQRDNINSLSPVSTLAAADLLGGGKDYWLYLKNYDPVSTAATIQKPLLLLQGERDYQVPITEFQKYTSALQNNSNVTSKSYPGINHLLYAGSGTPGPDEYNTPGNVSTDLLLDLSNWIIQH